MARTPTEGSGQGPHQTQATVLQVTEGSPVHLPEGVEIGALDLSRDGQDLVMTTPDGQVFVVEGYFLMPDAPLIISANGALLTPGLVQSFVTSLNDIEVAAGGQQSNDQTPVGEVTEVSGTASVTHADGTKETIVVGTQIFEGDIIETDAKGAVNIEFADESTFAVSQNARLAVDDFSFNADDQSGTTGVSILRGVFMFTSGLIGRENPDAVTLETPVGSIGIRGTIIGGQISPNGKSQISVIEGAIVVRNGSGEQILSDQFETVQLTGFNAPINNIGMLNANSMGKSYGAVRSVAPALFTSIDDTARDNNNRPQQQQTRPDTNEQPAEQPQPEAKLPSSLNDIPVVFQELTTGSNLNNPLGAPVQMINVPAQPPLVVAPPLQPSVIIPPASVQPVEVITDTRPPAALTFVSGGDVDEESAASTVVGTVAQVTAMPFPIQYSLTVNPGNLFTINSSTGEIRLTNTAGDTETGTSSYNLTVRATRTDTGQFTETPLTVAVNPVDEAPEFGTLGTSVTEGSHMYLTAAMIGATDPEGLTASLVYNVTSIEQGEIHVNGAVSTTFTQSQLDANLVKYVHFGEEPNATPAAGFTITATDSTGHVSTAVNVPVTVNPSNDAPTEQASAGGTRLENSTTVLTTSMLSHSDPDNTASEVVYNVSAATHLTLEKFDGSVWGATTSFTQQDIIDSKVRVTQTGAESTSASLTYTVTDGTDTSGTKSLNFTITNVNDLPVVDTSAGDTMLEDGSVILGQSHLYWTDAEGDTITYKVTAATHGELQYSATGTAPWTTIPSDGSGTFTQADIDNGYVRFLQNGDENATATFSYAVSDDGTTFGATQTITMTVTNVNDAPASVTPGDTTVDFDEQAGGGPAHVLTTLDIVDGEDPASNPNYSFQVQSWNGSSWGNDARFGVVDNAGTYELHALNGEMFNPGTITLQVVLTDENGAVDHVVTSSSITLTVNDTDQVATNFELNKGQDVSSTLAVSSIIQGGVTGAIIGVLTTNDTDTNASLLPGVSRYTITDLVGGGAYVKEDFEIVAMTDDKGRTELVLKLKDSANPNGMDFSAGPQAMTIEVTLDADLDESGAPLMRTFDIQGRQDMMVLESVNGKNGFVIENNSRFPGASNGARFGVGLAAGDFDGDGKIDLVIGAPLAKNTESTPEESGGIYAFNNTSLMTNANDGEVLLSSITGGGATGGFPYTELSNGTGVNDAFGMYGSQMVALRRFNGFNGTDIAILNPGDGQVEIRSGATGEIKTRVINIPTDAIVPADASVGQQLSKRLSITSAGDINGDGYTDLIIGTSLADNNGIDSGRIGIILGSPNHGTPVLNQIDFSTLSNNILGISQDAGGSHFGESVAGLGDFDGDGFADFAVSAPDADTNSSSAGAAQGRVFVYFGASNAGTSSISGTKLQIQGMTADERLGAKLASAGDFNGDGRGDLLMRSNTGQGTLYMVFGDDGLKSGVHNITNFKTDGTTDFHGAKIVWSQTDTDTNIKVGSIFGLARDFNGDGFDDIFVDVSKDLGGTFEHTLYILYGSAATGGVYNLDELMNDPDKAYKIKLFETTSDGITATSAGDLNGDGFDDMLIGTPGVSTDDGAQHDGAAYVVYGNNYDGVANDVMTTATASVTSGSYVGNASANHLDDGGRTGLSFRGGDGADDFSIHSAGAVRNYEGGSGHDKLTLFFSDGESSTGAATLVDLTGIGLKMSGVEEISFGADAPDSIYSLQDTLKLDIKDILSLMSSSDNGKLTISAMLDSPVGGENRLLVHNGGTTVTNLATLGFTKDVGSNGQDLASINGGTDNAYVYTHATTGFQLVVDSRLADAGNMSAT